MERCGHGSIVVHFFPVEDVASSDVFEEIGPVTFHVRGISEAKWGIARCERVRFGLGRDVMEFMSFEIGGHDLCRERRSRDGEYAQKSVDARKRGGR